MSHFASERDARLDKKNSDDRVETPENMYHTLQLTEMCQFASRGQESITGNTAQTDAWNRESCHSIKSGDESFYYTLTKSLSDDKIEVEDSVDSDKDRRKDFNIHVY